MKKILFMRHAKSDWNDPALTDKERPLNLRGQKAAAFMGNYFKQQGVMPNLIMVSTAVRTAETYNILAENMQYNGKVQWDDHLYLAPMQIISKTIRNASNDVDFLMIIGHNPGMESMVEWTNKEMIYAQMPTATAALFELNIDSWSDFSSRIGKLIWLVRPKELMNTQD